MVVLSGPGATSDIVVHFLRQRFAHVLQVRELPRSRRSLALGRLRRLGAAATVGQVAFVVIAEPLLLRRGTARIAAITDQHGMDRRPSEVSFRVRSVNDETARALLRRLHPAAVVLSGTRILSRETLSCVSCPVLNLHAGVTPRYRGVHGGYWALAEGRPDLAGSTVHLVDPGIDTGGILAQRTFRAEAGDSFATYPYLHLACGLPALVEAVELALAGRPLVPVEAMEGAERSCLRWHPTLWGYLWRRGRRGVR